MCDHEELLTWINLPRCVSHLFSHLFFVEEIGLLHQTVRKLATISLVNIVLRFDRKPRPPSGRKLFACIRVTLSLSHHHCFSLIYICMYIYLTEAVSTTCCSCLDTSNVDWCKIFVPSRIVWSQKHVQGGKKSLFVAESWMNSTPLVWWKYMWRACCKIDLDFEFFFFFATRNRKVAWKMVKGNQGQNGSMY